MMKNTLAGILLTLAASYSAIEAQETKKEKIHRYEVIVLDNSDDDFKNPPFNDTLSLIRENNVLNTLSGFNVCESIGGPNAIAIAKDNSFFVVQNASRKLSKYSPQGKLVFSIDKPVCAVSISFNGNVYCSERSSSRNANEKILVIDPNDGSIKKQVEGTTDSSLDLVVDDANDSVWVVGRNITRYDKNLNKKFEIDPIERYAVSVDYASDGTAWVLEIGHHIPGYNKMYGKNRLLNVSLDGKIKDTINLDSTHYCVSVDRNNNLVYVAGEKGAASYNKDGIEALSDESAYEVRVDQRDSSVWVAGHDVRHYSKDGELLSTIKGFSRGQKNLAIKQ